MKKCFCSFVGVIVAVALLPVAAAAVTTKQAGGWDDPATWEGDAVPGAEATVVVAHNVLLTNQTALLAACTVNAAKICTFISTSAVLRATEVTVAGTLTHTNNTATSTNALGQWVPNGRVYVICSNLTVSTGGRIDADLRGYRGGNIGGGNGYGPGGGGYGAWYSGGGGYGGLGGGGESGQSLLGRGPTYGVVSAPDQPGSGGGVSSGSNTTLAGGAGGGLIRIEAQGAVVVNGTITANGEFLTQPSGSYSAGGSGGGIFITCRVLEGSGAVSAVGGWARHYYGGGGGGGRIAVVVDTAAQSAVLPIAVQFRCQGGRRQYSGSEDGYPGSLYVTDSRLLPGRWNGREASARLSGFAEWSPTRLGITNAQVYVDSRATIAVAGDLSVIGTTLATTLQLASAPTVSCGGHMTVSNASVYLFQANNVTNMPTLLVGGDLSLATQTVLHVYAAMTNGTAPQAYGARVGVGGTMSLARGAVVYPYSNPTNGGSVLFSVKNLTVASGAGFSAVGAGFAGCPGGRTARGYGPGGGYGGAWGASGGGYGGRGGSDGGSIAGGPIYGVSNAPPVYAGSGGGGSVNTANAAGPGGGLIWLEARSTATLDGFLRANGGTPSGSGNYGGGGSGGGILVVCGTIQGATGTLSANGGPARPYSSGGGGGGRIQIWSTYNKTGGMLTTSVAPGAGGTSSGLPGVTGTVHWGTIPAAGTTVLIH